MDGYLISDYLYFYAFQRRELGSNFKENMQTV